MNCTGPLEAVKNISIVVGLLLLVQPASADDLDVLIRYSNIESTLAEASADVFESSLEKNPNLAPYRNEIREFFDENITLDNFRPGIEEIYNSVFSEQEVAQIAESLSIVKNDRELIEFYGTPLGQRLLAADQQVIQFVLMGAAQTVQQGVPAMLTELIQCRQSADCDR